MLLSSMAVTPAWAQGNQAQQAQDSAKAKAPDPIPLQDLIQNIEDASAEIKTIRRRIEEKDEIVSVDTLFPESVKFLKEQKEATESFLKSNPNRQKVNNQILKWNGYSDRLTEWQLKIDEYQERNVKLLERVRANEELWKLTYENTLDQNIQKEVANSVREIYRTFTDLREEIVRQNNEYLILESRINKQKVEITEVVDELEKLKGSEIYNLFYQRHDRLWKSDIQGLFAKSDRSETGTRFNENVSETYKYLSDHRTSVLRYFIYVLAFIFLIRWLNRVFRKYAIDENDWNHIRARQVIVNRGLAAILFLSFLGFIMYLDNRPTLLTDVLHLIILVLSVLLVRPFMQDAFKNLLYFIILVFLLDNVKTYIWFSSLQYRLYLLAEASLVIYLFYKYAFRKKSSIRSEQDFFGSLLVHLAPVFQIIAFVSIVANVLGYTNLADLALDVSTKSGVYALISFALLMVLAAISTGVIHNHFESRGLNNTLQQKGLEQKSLNFFRWIAILFWILIFLSFVDLLSPMTLWITDELKEPYSFGNLTITLGDILNFLLILASSFLITSLISFFIDSGQFKWKFLKLPKGIPAAISLVIRYFIIAAGIILALSSLGVDLSKFNLMAGALGLGIGFGLQNVISNFVSGLILVFERPILVGDTVEVNNLMGKVNRIGVRSSNISTFDGAEVVVPNSNLISNDLINWTLSSNIKRVEILIGAAYGTDPNQVLKLLLEVAEENEEILKDPSPMALFSEFGDSSLNFSLRFWVPFEIGLKAKSDASIAVYNKFKEHGIEIPFPQRDVHVKTVPPEQKDPGKEK